tara:strand:- start:60 stop:470 length:411 start_codon:yes stop_codon:yes gene_type:complete
MISVDWIKLLGWLQKNWKLVAILALSTGLWVKMRYDYKQLQNAYETTQQSLQNQIEGLQSIHAEELRQKESALQTYRDALDTLERQYREEQARIENDIEEEKEEIIEEIEERHQFSENKEELADRIEDTLGFEYVP